VVFVADSQIEQHPNNVETLRRLHENLERHGHELSSFPYVLQLNKRDIPGVHAVERLAHILGAGRPVVEAVAVNGVGVLATLRAIVGEISADTSARVDWDVLMPRTALRAAESTKRGVLAKLFRRLFE
jgi:mutual gliding-motility protein MglA